MVNILHIHGIRLTDLLVHGERRLGRGRIQGHAVESPEPAGRVGHCAAEFILLCFFIKTAERVIEERDPLLPRLQLLGHLDIFIHVGVTGRHLGQFRISVLTGINNGNPAAQAVRSNDQGFLPVYFQVFLIRIRLFTRCRPEGR